MKVSDTLSHRAVGAADVPASVGGAGCCPGANVCCADGLTCCEGQTRCCANCCANDVCCDFACNECVDNGLLSGGTIDVQPNPACIGDTITFTVSGVIDSGGTKRENCVEVPIAPGGVTYEWTLTLPPDYPAPWPPLSGSAASVSAVAKVPGTYSVTFTAKPTRTECPPDDITIGPETATVPPVTCDAQLSDGGGSQGDTIQLSRTITNTSSCEVTLDWEVATSGAPTVTPNPASGSITLQHGQSDYTPLSVPIAANSATGTETLTLTVTSGETTVCNATATVTVCDQCDTFNGTQCEPKPLCTACTPQGSTTCTPPGYACDGSGTCERGQNLIAQMAGQLGITYANQSTLGCRPGTCGARIQFDVTGLTHSCDSIDMEGANVTESVTTDNGCARGSVTTGSGCAVSCGNSTPGCTDMYRLCLPLSDVPAEGCTETYTQNLYIDGHLVETHSIVFTITITFPSGTCTGSVTRN